MRPLGAAAALVAAALVVTGCETTQDLSAKIGRRLGRQNAITGTVGVGAANRNVRVLRTVIVAGSPAAVAVEIANAGSQPFADVRVLIDVRDAKGASVYRNDTKGLDHSLQELSLLPARSTVWWVDNEVLASGGVPASASAQVGGASPATASPALAAHGVSASNSFPGPHVDATLTNRSAAAATGVAVYAVSLAHGRVVGAGRGLTASLGAHASASVEIAMTGAATGGTVALTLAP